MLGVVLVYLAYAAAAGAAVGAIGYVAAGRFSLVQRLLATLMSRTLDRIADSEQATYSVTHTDTGALAVLAARGRRQTSAEAELGLLRGAWCDWGTYGLVLGLYQVKNAVPRPRTSIAATTAVARTALRLCRPPAVTSICGLCLLPNKAPIPSPQLAGIVATGIAVGQHVLQHTEFGGTRASAASIQRLELRMPSLSRPLALQAHGVRLALHQVQLPTVSGRALGRSRSPPAAGGAAPAAGVLAAAESRRTCAGAPIMCLQPVTPEARAAQQEAAQLADKAARLAAVEELLWGSPQGGQRQPSRWNPASGCRPRRSR